MATSNVDTSARDFEVKRLAREDTAAASHVGLNRYDTNVG
jgi:hypothetical protein